MTTRVAVSVDGETMTAQQTAKIAQREAIKNVLVASKQ